MAQHQDLGVLPPLLASRQDQQRHGAGDDEEDQLQAHEPWIIARPDWPDWLARHRTRDCADGVSAEHLPWWRRFSAPTGALVCADEQARAWLAELPHDQVLPSDRPRRARTRRGRWLVCHASSLREARGSLGRQPESC
jgi:hypothetical protein